MNEVARHQVVETKHGYAVKDTRTNSIITGTYKRLGWAVRIAETHNERTKNFKYV